MLDALARIVGPSRAVSLYVALRRFGLPVVLVAGFVGILVAVILVSNPDRMEHLAYLEAEVVSVTPLTQDAGTGIWVDLRLPDGADLRLSETEGAIAAEIGGTACVEARRDTRSGEVDYRLRRAHRCAG